MLLHTPPLLLPSLLFGSATRQIFQIICKIETVCVNVAIKPRVNVQFNLRSISWSWGIEIG